MVGVFRAARVRRSRRSRLLAVSDGANGQISDDMDAPRDHVAGDAGLPDVSTVRLIDLLHNQDPALRVAVGRLEPLLHRTAEVRWGWQSAIDVE